VAIGEAKATSPVVVIGRPIHDLLLVQGLVHPHNEKAVVDAIGAFVQQDVSSARSGFGHVRGPQDDFEAISDTGIGIVESIVITNPIVTRHGPDMRITLAKNRAHRLVRWTAPNVDGGAVIGSEEAFRQENGISVVSVVLAPPSIKRWAVEPIIQGEPP